ncbi:hypothetical protein Q3G72_000481 [Acer saccharum]|nr:hypothetical protein Q3G72_000481 [Acer saccharum]
MHSSFLPIASLLLSIWGFVALTTAIEFPENLAIWKLKFVCCSVNAEALIFPENLTVWKMVLCAVLQIAAALVSHRRGFHSTNLKGTH